MDLQYVGGSAAIVHPQLGRVERGETKRVSDEETAKALLASGNWKRATTTKITEKPAGTKVAPAKESE